MKVYTIKKTRTGGRGPSPDRVEEIKGTIEELTKYFKYTLECGWSWNKKINTKPKTLAALVKNINASFDETQGACYARTYVEAVL